MLVDKNSPCARVAVSGLLALGLSLLTLDAYRPASARAEGDGLAGPAGETAAPVEPEPDTASIAADRTLHRGLEYLASHQREDGSFGSDRFRGNVGITGLAGLALLSGAGRADGQAYKDRAAKCLEYILANAQDNGLIADAQGKNAPMYGHGYAMLLLAECQRTSPRPELRQKLAKAVELVVKSQNKEGGWRYVPDSPGADLSVTTCELMALLAARDAGVEVPRETIDRAIAYVKLCQNEDGGFRYVLSGSGSAFPRSAAAMATLDRAGLREGPEFRLGLDYLKRFLPPGDNSQQASSFFYHGHYYAAQAVQGAGGKDWGRWQPAIRDALVASQRDDGSWNDTFSVDLATAEACLILQAGRPRPKGP